MAACGGGGGGGIDESGVVARADTRLTTFIQNGDPTQTLSTKGYVTQISEASNSATALLTPRDATVAFGQDGDGNPILFVTAFGEDLELHVNDMISEYEYGIEQNGYAYYVGVMTTGGETLEDFATGKATAKYHIPFGLARWKLDGDAQSLDGLRSYTSLGIPTDAGDRPATPKTYTGFWRGKVHETTAADYGRLFEANVTLNVDFATARANGSFDNLAIENDGSWTRITNLEKIKLAEADITATGFETTAYIDKPDCEGKCVVTDSAVRIDFFGPNVAEAAGQAVIAIDELDGDAADLIFNGSVSTLKQ